jgi:hypothetical protein
MKPKMNGGIGHGLKNEKPSSGKTSVGKVTDKTVSLGRVQKCDKPKPGPHGQYLNLGRRGKK